MAVNGKLKGKRLEAEVAKRLSEWLGLPASEFTRARAGKTEPDVALSQAAAEKFPFHIECKHRKVIALKDWIAQAVHDAPLVSFGREPIVIYKKERKLLVCTRLAYLAYMLHRLNQAGLELTEFVHLECVSASNHELWISLSFELFMGLATMPES